MKHLTKSDLKIRLFSPDDIDFVISRQIKLYEIEYGFNTEEWKAYVTNGVKKLVNQFDDNRDCIYILEYGGQPLGCIAITHVGVKTAQLRFFFIEDKIRGLGAGYKLINMAINFCKEKQYKHVFLWTFRNLDVAKHLYIKMGFQMKETRENKEWGSPIVEERWNLEL